jgi:hypothetical protein
MDPQSSRKQRRSDRTAGLFEPNRIWLSREKAKGDTFATYGVGEDLFSLAETAQMVQNLIYDISSSGECRFNLASGGGRNARDRPSCSFYGSDEHILDPRGFCKDLWCNRGCLGPRKRLPWHRDGFDKGIRSNEGFSCLP